MRPVNKFVRRQLAKKVLRRRNAALGLPTKGKLPLDLIKALSAGGYRIPTRDDRKRFGKSSGKRYYGHFSGHSHKHLGRRALLIRGEMVSHNEDLFRY